MQRFCFNEKAVKVLMAAKGIDTQERLAAMAGLSSLTLRRLFAGEAFRSTSVESLARALECNPFDLLTVEGYPAPHLDAPAITSA